MDTLGAMLREGAPTGWGAEGLRVRTARLDPRGDLHLVLDHGGQETRSIVYGAASSPAMALSAPSDLRARTEAVLAAWAGRPWSAWSEVACAVLDAWIDAPPAGSLAAWCASGLRVPEIEVRAAGLVVRLEAEPARLRRDWRGFGELSAPARVRRRVEDAATEGGVAGTPPPLAPSGASSGGRGEDASAEGGAEPGAASGGPRPRRSPPGGGREGGVPPAPDDEDVEHVHAGALRMGRLGAPSDGLTVDPARARDAWEAWCARVARRLQALVASAGTDGMVVPWLVQPRAPFGEIVERWIAEGPPPEAPGRVRADAPWVRALAEALRAEDDAGTASAEPDGRAHAFRAGPWRVVVDVPAGRLTLARDGEAPAVLVRTDPWDAGRRGGLDGDVVTTLRLARGLGLALVRAGLDAEVSWVPWDPDVARADEIPDGARLSTWLAFGTAPEEVEATLDWRVEGLGLEAAPWPTWEGPGLDDVPAEEVARQVALRDAFVRSFGGSVPAGRDAVVFPGGVDPGDGLA
ncbi:MAG: hypothetical protein RLZZ299_2811 [Pseudomonadota bacterium]